MNYYQFHIGDFNSATRNLTRVQRALYRDLVDMYYDKESPIPLDLASVKFKLGVTSDEESDLNILLKEFFCKQSDGYHNSRCDSEIEKYQTNTTAKKKAGLASAAKRKQNSTRVEQPLKSVQLTKNQEPRTINHKPIKDSVKKFIKPSISDIREYCTQRKNNIDPEYFFDSNEAKGWVIGKTKTPMKDWKAVIRTWEKNSNEKSSETHKSKSERVRDRLDELAREEIRKNGYPENLG